MAFARSKNTDRYNRVRQMTMDFAVAWSGICLSTLSSIYARSEGAPLTAPVLTAAVLYLFIVAGRDRKTLWVGFSLGAVTALSTICFQDRTLLF